MGTMMTLQGYINLFVGFIAATAILYVPVLFIMKKKGQGLIRQSSYLLWFWSLFFVIFLTLILFNLPIHFTDRYSLNLVPLHWLYEEDIKRRIMIEIRPNIMAFIPLGFFTPIAFKQMQKLYKTALLVFAVTFSIEFFQYFTGRSADIDDIMANLLGGIIGYGIFKIFGHVFRNKMC